MLNTGRQALWLHRSFDHSTSQHTGRQAPGLHRSFDHDFSLTRLHSLVSQASTLSARSQAPGLHVVTRSRRSQGRIVGSRAPRLSSCTSSFSRLRYSTLLLSITHTHLHHKLPPTSHMHPITLNHNIIQIKPQD